MTDEEMERELRIWHNPYYAEPRKILVARFSFDDYDNGDIDVFINALTKFRAANVGAEFTPIRRGDFDYLNGFDAERMETPEEAAVRVEGYRQAARQRIEEREQADRLTYDRLKRKYGGWP
jgi:hypothetical protein